MSLLTRTHLFYLLQCQERRTITFRGLRGALGAAREDSGGEEEEGAAGHARSPASEEVDAVKQGDPTVAARSLWLSHRRKQKRDDDFGLILRSQASGLQTRHSIAPPRCGAVKCMKGSLNGAR